MTNTLLFASHTPSTNTEKLATICAAEMLGYCDDVTLIHKPPLEIVAADGLACDGLVIATTENIGYMAGLTKDMFDRCYNDWLYHTDGLPVAFYIRAGLDGTATAATLGQSASVPEHDQPPTGRDCFGRVEVEFFRNLSGRCRRQHDLFVC